MRSGQGFIQLKTFKDEGCTTSLGNLFCILNVLMESLLKLFFIEPPFNIAASQPVPSLYCCKGLLLLWCRTLYMPFLSFIMFLLAHSSSPFLSFYMAALPLSQSTFPPALVSSAGFMRVHFHHLLQVIDKDVKHHTTSKQYIPSNLL